MLKRIAVFAFFLGLPAAVLGDVVWSVSQGHRAREGALKVYTATVTSNADGTTASTPTSISGKVNRVITDPGTLAPTDLYDCRVEDLNGADLMGGALGNRSNVTTEAAYPLSGTTVVEPLVSGNVSLNCTAMGNATNTVVRIYVEE